MKTVRKDFLWAEQQPQISMKCMDVDGKGVAIPDLCTNEHIRFQSEFTDGFEEGTLYPSHEATDFYHHYKEDIALFAEMDSKLSECLCAWTRSFSDRLRETPNEKAEFIDHI